MKKVAVIWSSPNKNGLTASAKEQISKGISEGGAEVCEIHLNSKNINHCRAFGNGWGTCNKNGSCVIIEFFVSFHTGLDSKI